MTRNEIKKVQLDILSYFNKICLENNIHYTVYGGTLIGALRHGGFIPWDDDIDVALYRDDYDKVLKILQDENKYRLHNYRNRNFEQPFAKLSDKRTIQIGPSFSTRNLGCFIDIFPIDKYPENIQERELYRKKLQKEFRIALDGSFPEYFSSENWLKVISKIFLRFPRFVMHKGDLYHRLGKIDDELQKFNRTDSKICGYILSPYEDREKFHVNVLNSFEMVDFEDIKVMKIKNHDEYLSSTFGDYMTMPPEDKRRTHNFYNFYWK